jgi:hypothetical protein
MANGSNTKIFRKIYLGILIFIAVSLPLSRSTMTQGMVLLLTLWIWSDFQMSVVLRFFKQKNPFSAIFLLIKYLWTLAKESIPEKINRFLGNKPAVIFASVYLMGLFGLLFTGNFPKATLVLRIQLPLLLFPLVFAGFDPIKDKDFRTIMLFYVAALFAGTIIGTVKMISGDFVDVRQFSPFISPVRFGLNITFGIFVLFWFLVKDAGFHFWQKGIMGFLIIWFIWFLVKMESVTSLCLLMVIGGGVLFWQGIKSTRKEVKWITVFLFVGIPVVFAFYLKSELYEMTHARVPKRIFTAEKTAQGHPYTFDTIHYGIEDGQYVGSYLCLPELKQAWNRRSRIPFDGKDKNGNSVATTLIRYLTSKNLKKDAAGVAALSQKDIRNIENGIANSNYVCHPGLHSRLLMMVKGWQVYQKTGKAGGSSIIQRVAYLQAAFQVIRKNFWTGTGTGDLFDALGHEYIRLNAGLENYVGFLAHNQYVDIFAAYGIFGFLWFLFALVYPPVKTKSFQDYFFVTFYLIMLGSMLSDDTLETHAGVTLFSFFLSLLMFGKERKEISAE